MNRTDLEQKAAESVLVPLADYVMAVGMEKGLGDYSKTEIVGLVDTVLSPMTRLCRSCTKTRCLSDVGF